MKIGYTSGVFDLFHYGHLNLLMNAKKNCDFLIVGVCSDCLTYKLKNRFPVHSIQTRFDYLTNLKCVDRVFVKTKDDDFKVANKMKAEIVFKGSDWINTRKWVLLETKFLKKGIEVKFFEYTKGISSTQIRSGLKC